MQKNVVEIIPGLPNRFIGMTARSLSKVEQDSVIDLALNVLSARHRPGAYLGSPDDTKMFLTVKMAEYRNEVFGAIFLDHRRRVLGIDELFQGSIDRASVHPRVVVQRALERNAVAVVFFHNHPSGVAEPSRSDETLTVRLKDALALVDIRVLDHLVVGVEAVASFAERGLL